MEHSPAFRQGRRRLLAAAPAMALLAAGCGRSAGAGRDRLTMWTFKQSHVKALDAAAAAFTAQTGTKLAIQAITPDDAFLTKVQAAARTNDLPDVIEVHANGDDLSFGGAGLLEDLAGAVGRSWLDTYLPQVRKDGAVTAAQYRDSLTEGSKTMGVKEGQRFSVPLTVGTFGIVYADRRRLASAGVTEPPATWEQFIDTLAAVHRTDPKRGGITIGVQQPSTALEWLMQPMAFGMLGKERFQALFGSDPSKGFASADGQRVLTEYGRVTPYWMPGTAAKSIDDADLSFAQGKSAFLVGGTFTLAFLAANGADPANIMTFPVPPPARAAIPGMQLSPFALTGLSVTRTSRRKDEAMAWLRFLSKPDVAADFGRAALDVPPNLLTGADREAVGPLLTTMLDSFGTGENAYNAGDTTYRPSLYDPGKVGAVLAGYTPLKSTGARQTGNHISSMIKSYWAEQ
ncbi:ABC transporter substrate-binding protein [Streptomyces sp. NPDC048462]|uniref:ABC transporter substrate-binding protein n=1 Tax=Streptomyces sp. NPDC048462 TaxID=3365555 RepID=UPI00371848BA